MGRPVAALQCGHDHSVMESRRYRPIAEHGRAIRFNVAMTIQSWKELNKELLIADKFLLQCGHDHSVMERSI